MAAPKLGYRTTAEEALRGADLRGKRAIVTGGNSGLGAETVRVLAGAGADVVLCSRSVQAGQVVADAIAAAGAPGKVTVAELDLASLPSVGRFAASAAATALPLHLLVLNAGVMAPPLGRTEQGFETQIGVNHIAHQYLTGLLLPGIKAQGEPARVICVSSVGHKMGTIVLDDLNYERRSYSRWPAYGQSKLANILFTKELARRLREEKSAVEAFVLHPGVIPTPLGRHMGWLGTMLNAVSSKFQKTVPQGAATTVWAATAPELAGRSGAYLADCQVAEPNRQAQDADMARALWDKTEELIAAATTKS